MSVDGIRYDLYSQTQPTADQVIELFLIIGGEIEAPSRQEPLEHLNDTCPVRELPQGLSRIPISQAPT